MRVLVKKNTWLPRVTDFGWGNGYAFIPEGHPFHGLHYDAINEHVSIHGGLTFSKHVNIEMCVNWDLNPDLLGSWCVGFDTCHCDDTLEYWTEDRVMEETQRLKKQLLTYI